MVLNHRANLESSLKELHKVLIDMGDQVKHSIYASVESLKNGDLDQAKEIIEKDKSINDLENKVMELAARTIATQQPIATDMRKILCSIKIASDLERMGDLSVDISKVTIRIGGEALIKPLVDIPRMAELVSNMVTECMESYIKEDIDLAFKMAKMDDEVDHLYSQILRELFVFMLDNPKTINQGMLLTFVGRYLERIADHATNIGESVVYLVRGERPDLN